MNNHDEFLADLDRSNRSGLEESVLCSSKTYEQLDAIIERLMSLNQRMLFTRLDPAKYDKLSGTSKTNLRYDKSSLTAILNYAPQVCLHNAVAIVSAGTSDSAVVAEVKATLHYYGYEATIFQDVGVAGLWRILNVVETLNRFPIIISVAGMDAALPTVLAGLVKSIMIAVPTSSGYGVAAGGTSALHSILASCSPGITVVNIDNGFGAACAAVRVLNNSAKLASLIPTAYEHTK